MLIIQLNALACRLVCYLLDCWAQSICLVTLPCTSSEVCVVVFAGAYKVHLSSHGCSDSCSVVGWCSVVKKFQYVTFASIVKVMDTLHLQLHPYCRNALDLVPSTLAKTFFPYLLLVLFWGVSFTQPTYCINTPTTVSSVLKSQISRRLCRGIRTC